MLPLGTYELGVIFSTNVELYSYKACTSFLRGNRNIQVNSAKTIYNGTEEATNVVIMTNYANFCVYSMSSHVAGRLAWINLTVTK